MGVQMFLVHPKNTEDEDAREQIAQFVAQRGGFILMATSHGSIIAAFEEGYLDALKANVFVEFASGLTFDPSAPGASALQQVFAQNIAAQLRERGITPGAPGAGLSHSPSFPPGYRPLRWPTTAQEGGGGSGR
jgi:hypothetical protein